MTVKDELSRIAGVGDVTVFGAGDYSMRIWLDPQKLKQRGLTTDDVLNASDISQMVIIQICWSMAMISISMFEYPTTAYSFRLPIIT